MYQSKIITTYMERVKQVIDNKFPLMVNCPKCEHDIEPAALIIARNDVRELLLDGFQDFLTDLRGIVGKSLADTVTEIFGQLDEQELGTLRESALSTDGRD